MLNDTCSCTPKLNVAPFLRRYDPCCAFKCGCWKTFLFGKPVVHFYCWKEGNQSPKSPTLHVTNPIAFKPLNFPSSLVCLSSPTAPGRSVQPPPGRRAWDQICIPSRCCSISSRLLFCVALCRRFACLFVPFFVRLFVCLLACLSVSPSICPSLRPSVCLLGWLVGWPFPSYRILGLNPEPSC